ncbi:MAG: tol-pal system protein YbgF [Alphaproteobacteria bacterium]|nr:tol-pal system protein YbgF [Alphaproteobacteria bacterium]
MIRRWISSHARPTLLLVLFATAVLIVPAQSQDRSMQDRLDRLEKDLSMLQRQVYRGGTTPVITPPPGEAVDVELRMGRLEAQMRELTGRVEDAMNAVEQLRRRVEQVNSDVDLRLGQGQGPPQGPPRTATGSSQAAAGMTDTGPTGPMAMRGPPPGANPPIASPPGSTLMPPGTPVPPPQDTPATGSTLTPPGPRQLTPPQSANVGAAGGLRPPSGGELPSGSVSKEYNFAFGLLKQADYPAAEEAFRDFIARHPDDPLAGTAQYWLGETYYARRRYAEAASAFADGYKRYPKGAKAADDLLKLGMSLARANQKQNACVALVQLDHDFPKPGSAIKGRSAAEKKRLGC